MHSIKTIVSILLVFQILSCKDDSKNFLWLALAGADPFGSILVKSMSFESEPNQLTTSYPALIDENANTISISLPYGIVQRAIPSFILNNGSWKLSNGTILQSGGSVIDLTNETELVFESENGTETNYSLSLYQTVPVPDTNVSECQDNSNYISCGNTNLPNQDGDVQNSPNAPVYTTIQTLNGYTNDPVVVDSQSGVVWKSCLEGLSGSNCTTGAASGQTWTSAKTTCANLNSANSGNGYAGLKNWRIVSRKEMDFSIGWLQAGVTQYSLPYKDKFPGRDSASQYDIWVMEEDPSDPTNKAFSYGIGSCCGFPVAKSTATYKVQCVAAAPVPNPDFASSEPGVVLDKRTGIEWAKCPVGRSGSNCEVGSTSQNTYEILLNACNNLNTAGKQWRMPIINELSTLVDYSGGSFISTTAFPSGLGTANALSWVYSSTPSRPSTTVLTNALIPAMGVTANTGKNVTSDRTALCVVR
ncbi:DUF1566 domain-containing protein [Leptospira wolffii]|uniref:Lcl domain-containing protein n=1 Tax=Leptospira wolffii TaxID=409998 RepID=UPI00108233C9|nr:DUF1566 domain-containing protein [Leptospira wolffii]TGK61767.1 DUF1566 domain-containing protein [Leptospira wolffii]TGK70310.1 DUF1566 domain-containing protein [Leptospira wolffii]TGK74945.1 DUF1566 domain-containing protein [Leptospira wolffii]TGL30914.1 DUF1566 domain-containing protein [Leptospira wolffii]